VEVKNYLDEILCLATSVDHGSPRAIREDHGVTGRREGVMLMDGSTMGNTVIPSYLEIIDFIAAGTTPQAIVDYRPSLEAQQRVAELIEREKEGGLSTEEQSELDHFIDLEHILRMAKGRAQQILISGS
jgi:hypothetical protein